MTSARDPVTVHMRHVRAANLCSRGARTWFLRHGFSWTNFLMVGYPSDVLEATKDPFAEKVVAEARKEFRRG